MARVKTDWRANLSTPRLSDLMRRFQPNARSSFVVECWDKGKTPLNFTLMDKTQTIIVCHSFYSAVQY